MGLRLRTRVGGVQELPNHQFVEICDSEGRVAILIYEDHQGMIHTVKRDDPAAQKYCAMFPGVEFVPVITLPPHLTKPPR